jgi:hypothetical protein
MTYSQTPAYPPPLYPISVTSLPTFSAMTHHGLLGPAVFIWEYYHPYYQPPSPIRPFLPSPIAYSFVWDTAGIFTPSDWLHEYGVLSSGIIFRPLRSSVPKHRLLGSLYFVMQSFRYRPISSISFTYEFHLIFSSHYSYEPTRYIVICYLSYIT